MTRVYLWQGNMRYGYLTEEGGKYVWTPDVASIESVDPIHMILFPLPRKKTSFKEVPPIYDSFAFSQRADLVEQAKVLPTDTPFERLVKFAALHFTPLHYYISLCETYDR